MVGGYGHEHHPGTDTIGREHEEDRDRDGGTKNMGATTLPSEITAIGNNGKGYLQEVASRAEGISVFAGVRWFQPQKECE